MVNAPLLFKSWWWWWRRNISADLGWQLKTLGQGRFGLADDLIDSYYS